MSNYLHGCENVNICNSVYCSVFVSLHIGEFQFVAIGDDFTEVVCLLSTCFQMKGNTAKCRNQLIVQGR